MKNQQNAMKRLTIILAGLSVVACATAHDDWPFDATEVASFDEPWAMVFLPDGRLLKLTPLDQ